MAARDREAGTDARGEHHEHRGDRGERSLHARVIGGDGRIFINGSGG